MKTAVKNKSKKPDVLIVDSSKKVVAYIECKKPDEFDTDKKVQAAIKQEIEVAKELGVKIFVATDGSKFVWINALTGQPILDEHGKVLHSQNLAFCFAYCLFDDSNIL